MAHETNWLTDWPPTCDRQPASDEWRMAKAGGLRAKASICDARIGVTETEIQSA